MLRLSQYLGNPYLGVHCAANEEYAFVPRDAPQALVTDLEEALGVQVEKCTLGETNLIGTLLSLNSFGAVVTNMATNAEVEFLSRFLPVYRIQDKINASGNNILVNDTGALANPDLGHKTLRAIEETLQVRVEQGELAGHKTVGSACVVTNKGALCHPSTSPAEMESVRSVFRVPAAIGTLNYGAPLVGACMVANSKGGVAGYKSTPIELGRAEDALGLI
ncbi:MAG TPA: translation initiation factor IF-6 [Methanomassiliicoccales archaeon]|nr:translation initiation factor IF-6 [Methanomassiliicoccales archaeon]